MSVRVLAIVVCYRNDGYALDCLRQLRASHYAALSLLVVSNGPFKPPGVLAEMANWMMETPNQGFAAACNIGIRFAIEKIFDYIWLVNDDLFVQPETLDDLMGAMRDPKVAFCCPKIVYHNKSDTLQFAGGFIQADGRDWLPRGEWEKDCGQYDRVEEVDWLSGGCMLARVKAIAEIGPLDEDYFLYYEDVDWCVRAGNLHWKCIYVGTSAVTHIGSQSAGVVQRFYAPRAKFLFLIKHYPHWLWSALRRYYWHQLHPHWSRRDWRGLWLDARILWSTAIMGLMLRAKRTNRA
jgi:hypothetical protein